MVSYLYQVITQIQKKINDTLNHSNMKHVYECNVNAYIYIYITKYGHTTANYLLL